MCRSKIKFFITTLVAILFLSQSGYTRAQNLEQSLASLRGVNKAGVIVEKVSQVLHDNGINEDDIRRDALEKLDFAGITVLQDSTMHKLPGAPYIYINIGAVKGKQDDIYAVNLVVEFRQNVSLIRNPQLKYFGAATWSVSNIGIFSADKLKEIREFTKNLVEKFVKDYLKANKIEEAK